MSVPVPEEWVGCIRLVLSSLRGFCLSSGELVNPGTQGLYGLVGWVHGHAAGCGALPSLQHTLSSEYCGSLQTVWACAQGHRYTMNSDTSCGALLLDSSMAVKCAWDKELGAQASQHQGPNPTGAAPQTSPGRSALAAGAETEMQPRMDTAQLPSDSSPMGPGPGPPLQPSLPSRGVQGRRCLQPMDKESCLMGMGWGTVQ